MLACIASSQKCSGYCATRTLTCTHFVPPMRFRRRAVVVESSQPCIELFSPPQTWLPSSRNSMYKIKSVVQSPSSTSFAEGDTRCELVRQSESTHLRTGGWRCLLRWSSSFLLPASHSLAQLEKLCHTSTRLYVFKSLRRRAFPQEMLRILRDTHVHRLFLLCSPTRAPKALSAPRQ